MVLAFYWYQDGGGAAHAPRPDAVTRVMDGFASISIQHEETLDFVAPSRASITTNVHVASGASKSLYPSTLVRQYHWNIAINGTPQSIVAKVGPLLNIGFSIDGDGALRNDDFLPLSVLEKSIMSARLIVGSGLGSNSSVNCGDSELAGGSLVVAGSTAIHSLAKLWAGVFETLCAEDAILVNVTDSVTAEGSVGSINDTSSSEGARLVCNQTEETTVDIGTMDRDWVIPNEATASSIQNGQFECADSGKQVLQIRVATQALSVVTSLQGTAFDCLQHLGGLTLDELRWIFSSLSEQELINDGVEDVPINSDGNNVTHLWSELDIGNENGIMICQAEEILLAGPEEMSSEYNFMSRLLFNQGLGETIDKSRETSDYSYFSSSVPQYIVDYLVSNENAIAFLPYGIANEHKNMLAHTPLSEKLNINNGPNPPKVIPDPISVEAGRYPLAQPLYMNLNVNEASLAYSLPYMEFGLSLSGQRLAEFAGHVPLSNQTLREMENRLALLKNHSMRIAIPVTEPPTFSPAAPGGQDTPQPAMSSTQTTQPSPGTGGDTSQPMVLSSAPTTVPQPVPTNNQSEGQGATIQPTTTETTANETTRNEVDSSTKDSGNSSSSSSSGGSLNNPSRSLLGSMLGIATLLFS
jgi:ABC-type phosphate transport system substrate-binding protein